MPVNQTFANYSDLAFKAAFAIYIVALVMSLVYYVKQQMLIDARRESKVLVGAGGDEITGASEPQDIFEARADAADKFGGMAQSLVWLGIIIHGTSVVLRGLSAGRFPWGNLYEYVSVTTFVALAIAAVVFQRREYRIVWPWVLTPVLALLFYGGTKLYAQSGPVVPALQSFWFPFHVSTVSIGGGIGLISGLASLMPLPSAKTLDAIAYRAAIWALPIFGLGVVLGALWAEAAWGRFWGWDPKETVSFITWMLYAAYLHARATSGWRDQRAAWINVFAFATMVFNLFFINIVVSGLHSYAGLN